MLCCKKTEAGGQEKKQGEQIGATETILVRCSGGLDHGGHSRVSKSWLNTGYFKSKTLMG